MMSDKYSEVKCRVKVQKRMLWYDSWKTSKQILLCGFYLHVFHVFVCIVLSQQSCNNRFGLVFFSSSFFFFLLLLLR